MTVIAYRDGVLAGDTLISGGSSGTRYGQFTKIVKHHGHLMGFAGAAAAMTKLRSILLAVPADKFGPDMDLDFDGDVGCLLVTPDGTAYFYEGESTPGFFTVTAPFFALGSGEQIALGAMAAGASAPEAVRIAIDLSSGCGGQTQVIRLDTADKL